MAKSRDPFLRALDEIRACAQAGGYPSGQPIIIVEEARRLGLSTTPIREALSCLCGEGVIERGPSGGFLAPRLDAGVIRDLYDFRLACLLAALDLTADLTAPIHHASPEGGFVGDLQALFGSIAVRTGNSALLSAYRHVEGQLRQLQTVEADIFPDPEAEAERLLVLADGGAPGPFQEALREYHHRRGRAAALLAVERIRRSGDERGEETGA